MQGEERLQETENPGDAGSPRYLRSKVCDKSKMGQIRKAKSSNKGRERVHRVVARKIWWV